MELVVFGLGSNELGSTRFDDLFLEVFEGNSFFGGEMAQSSGELGESDLFGAGSGLDFGESNVNVGGGQLGVKELAILEQLLKG